MAKMPSHSQEQIFLLRFYKAEQNDTSETAMNEEAYKKAFERIVQSLVKAYFQGFLALIQDIW